MRSQTILTHKLKFIDSPVTPSALEAQGGKDPQFSRSRRESLLFSGRCYHLPFYINKQAERLIRIQIFYSARSSYLAQDLTLLFLNFMSCMKLLFNANENFVIKAHLS